MQGLGRVSAPGIVVMVVGFEFGALGPLGKPLWAEIPELPVCNFGVRDSVGEPDGAAGLKAALVLDSSRLGCIIET